MKTLRIEWRHIDEKGETCDRCYDTGENLASEIKRLKRALEPKGIEIIFTETKLDASRVSESNTVLFNDVPIEDLIDIRVLETRCESCTELLKKETNCRAVVFDGNEYDDIPAKAIRRAAYKALGLEAEEDRPAGSCGCGGSCC